MLFGICGADLALARIARNTGYDYFEWGVGDLLHPDEQDEIFTASLAQIKALEIPCPVLNRFLPAGLKITGPDVNLQKVQSYVSTALQRAEAAGVEIIVLGAGGARRFPEGFDPTQAWYQVVDFCRWMAPVAARHGVTIAIEPLNVKETNLINTAEEAATLVRSVDHPNIRMLIDGYHWAKDKNTTMGILTNAALLVHAHVATVEGRKAPSRSDTCDEFFEVLRRSGYQGRLSFEGNLESPESELAETLSVMRSQFDTI